MVKISSWSQLLSDAKYKRNTRSPTSGLSTKTCLLTEAGTFIPLLDTDTQKHSQKVKIHLLTTASHILALIPKLHVIRQAIPGFHLNFAPHVPSLPTFNSITAMTEDTSHPAKPSSPIGAPSRRVLTGDESAQSRYRLSTNRLSTSQEAPPQGIRRRSSNFSDYSLREARKSFQSSTDDLLLPKPSKTGYEVSHDSSAWDSAPLAFALLPALGGMLFTNGSSVITDVMLLGLAAIFLNWSVRLPW